MTQSLLDLADLLPSWELAMRAEAKSEATIKLYTGGVVAFLRWCEQTSTPPVLTKPTVQAFLGAMLADGREAATTQARLKGLRRYVAWLLAEEEIDTDPLAGIKAPRGDQKIVHALTGEQVKDLVKACRGKTMIDRRDEAIVRLTAETGMRHGEVTALQVPDINLADGLVTIRRGKGRKGRVVPFGPQTATALDRYLRARRTNGHAALWLGVHGNPLSYHGLDDALRTRARRAGIEGFYPHLLRHTFATRWKAARGSDDGLMAVAGWSSRTMIDRYAGAAAAERAAAEARTLGLGEL